LRNRVMSPACGCILLAVAYPYARKEKEIDGEVPVQLRF
jgi:hypothetical protein